MGLWDEGAEFLLGAISESKCLEPLVESAEVADRLNLVDIAQPVEKIAVPVTHVFDIPETGMVTLGELMRGTPPELHTQLLQQVWDSRPGVPVGSWMRLIHPEDTTSFLRSGNRLYPNLSETADYLVQTRNLRPATPESPPIDFEAWERALETIKREKI